jgi:hypothetical protein
MEFACPAARVKLTREQGLLFHNGDKCTELVLGAYIAKISAAVRLTTQHQCVSPAQIIADSLNNKLVCCGLWLQQSDCSGTSSRELCFSDTTNGAFAAVHGQLHVCQYLHSEVCSCGHTASVAISSGFWSLNDFSWS